MLALKIDLLSGQRHAHDLYVFTHPRKRLSERDTMQTFDDLPKDDQRKWTGKFHAVQRAYEAVEAHLLYLDRKAENPAYAAPAPTTDEAPTDDRWC